MSKSRAVSKPTVEPEVPEDATPTDPIITPDTPPTDATPTDPVPTPEPEADPVPEEKPEPKTEEPVVEPSPEPEVEERPVPEGDKPVESLPVGSVEERALTLVSKIEDEEVRMLLMKSLADQRVFSKDWDVRYRMETANIIREMVRWIRTNIPSSATYKTFMDGVNHYLQQVETQAIPSMWSKEAADAPLDEIQARKAAMAIERAAENLGVYNVEVPVEVLRAYAQEVREGKTK